jgi:hypothetical protein
MSRSFLLSSIWALVLTAFGCTSQVDDGYRGEPLAKVSGTVETDGTTIAPASVAAALVWAQARFGIGSQQLESLRWLAESTPVTGQFPAKFTLNIYQPPPAEALIACPSSTAHIAAAFVVAFDGAADLSAPDFQKALVGRAAKYLLFYVDSDQAAGWSCFPDLGFTLTTPAKGYHLMQVVPNSTQPRAGGAVYPAYHEAPSGLATEVAITIGLTALPSP